MLFNFPGCDGVKIRLFESVTTDNDCYHIVDVGLQYDDNNVDGFAFGVALAKQRTKKARKKAAKKAKKAAAKRKSKIE